MQNEYVMKKRIKSNYIVFGENTLKCDYAIGLGEDFAFKQGVEWGFFEIFDK